MDVVRSSDCDGLIRVLAVLEIKISLNHYILSRSNCKDLRRVGFCKGGWVKLRICANVYIGTQNANHTIDLQIKVLRILFGQICGSSTQKFAVENEPIEAITRLC